MHKRRSCNSNYPNTLTNSISSLFTCLCAQSSRNGKSNFIPTKGPLVKNTRPNRRCLGKNENAKIYLTFSSCLPRICPALLSSNHGNNYLFSKLATYDIFDVLLYNYVHNMLFS
jgi:hypothetical protein